MSHLSKKFQRFKEISSRSIGRASTRREKEYEESENSGRNVEINDRKRFLKVTRTKFHELMFFTMLVAILFTQRKLSVKFYFLVFYRRKFVAQIQLKKPPFPQHLKFSIHRSKFSCRQSRRGSLTRYTIPSLLFR